MQRTRILLASLLLLMAAGIVAGLVALAVASAEFEEDVTPPVITDVRAYVAPSSVLIIWTTDEPATTEVWFYPSAGDNTDGGMASSGAAVEVNPYGGGKTLSTSHSVGIGEYTARRLESDTTYTYTVTSVDSAGNEAVSAEYTFTTLPHTSGAM